MIFNFAVGLPWWIKSIDAFIPFPILGATVYDCSFIKEQNYHIFVYYSIKLKRFFLNFMGIRYYEIDV